MVYFFFFNDTATTEIYTLSLHDALPIYQGDHHIGRDVGVGIGAAPGARLLALEGRGAELVADEVARRRSEEHTSELQSRQYLVCRLLLEKKKKETRLLIC